MKKQSECESRITKTNSSTLSEEEKGLVNMALVHLNAECYKLTCYMDSNAILSALTTILAENVCSIPLKHRDQMAASLVKAILETVEESKKKDGS